jgi:hypothetical protein
MNQISDSDRLRVFNKRVKELQEAHALSHSSAMLLAGQANGRSMALERRVEALEKLLGDVVKRLKQMESSAEAVSPRTR